MVLFGLLILQKILSCKKIGTFIRYSKGIRRFHSHGHKILETFPLSFCKPNQSGRRGYYPRSGQFKL